MEQTATMVADTKALVDSSVDVAALLGRWVNANQHTEHVTSVVVAERDSSLVVRLYGAADRPVDWGEVEAVPYAFTGSRTVAGFHARYSLGGASIEIAANVKLGILVIQTYTQFDDGRLSQFSREFFYRSDSSPAAAPRRTGRTFLTGEWVNTYAETRWITGFTLTEVGRGMTLRVRAAEEPTDWGEVEVDTFLDGAGDPAFHGRYELGDRWVELAGNTGKCIIIVEAFVRHKADESANFFSREFFVPR
jgi:hypothetical protein